MKFENLTSESFSMTWKFMTSILNFFFIFDILIFHWKPIHINFNIKTKLFNSYIVNKSLTVLDVDHLLWLHNNERSKCIEKCSKNFATLLAKIIEKYLWCTSSHLQMFPKVSVFKKAFNTAVLLKRDSNTKMPFMQHILLENVSQCLHILKKWNDFLKERKKRKSVIRNARPFTSAISRNMFPLKHWSIEAWN